jgi:hypothetical protein
VSIALADQTENQRTFDQETLGAIFRKGLDDVATEQRELAAIHGISEDALSKWKTGSGLKDRQFAVLFDLYRRSPEVRRLVDPLLGRERQEELEDPALRPLFEGLLKANRRVDREEILSTFAHQLRWLGLLQGVLEPAPARLEDRHLDLVREAIALKREAAQLGIETGIDETLAGLEELIENLRARVDRRRREGATVA